MIKKHKETGLQKENRGGSDLLLGAMENDGSVEKKKKENEGN